MSDELCLPVRCDADMVPARAHARELANRLGFSRTDATLIATAVSEIARNIVMHVGHGELSMNSIREERRCGLRVVARDAGPGIPDVAAALETGFASRGGMGLGLPGARRLMDDFAIDSEPGRGTTVTMTKWRRFDELERLRERRRRG
jgi:anti-sigma regulatory factor (Ser/Thr protein kinase)